MRTWKPDTCECYINLDDNSFIEQCQTHNNVNQVMAHNRSFNNRNGINPTEQQLESQMADKAIEKNKAEFKRRNI